MADSDSALVRKFRTLDAALEAVRALQTLHVNYTLVCRRACVTREVRPTYSRDIATYEWTLTLDHAFNEDPVMTWVREYPG